MFDAGAATLAASAFRADRLYAEKCTQPDTASGGFDEHLREYVATIQQRPLQHGKLLILRDEFRGVGLGHQLVMPRIALWLGLATRRATFIQKCDPDATGGTERVPRCSEPHFSIADYFRLRHNGSLAWTPEIDIATRNLSRATVWKTNWTEIFDGDARDASVVTVRAFFSEGTAQTFRDQLWTRSEFRRSKMSTANLLFHGAFHDCSGYAATRPTERTAALIAPLLPALRAARHRVGLHLRTLASDSPQCFPPTTAPDRESIDAAFGNDVCMRTIFDHWRWKLVPTGAQSDAACNETKHLADVFPLSRWLPCAAGLFADGGGNGTVVFLTTDAPAVYRYAERHGAAAVAPATLVMLPGGERAIGHTGARPERPRRKGAAPTPIDSHPDPHAVFARGAADWTLLSLCDAMLGPVQSFFARSACEARAMEPSCHVFEPLKQMNQRLVSSKQVGTCALSRCFPSALLQPPHKAGQCARCAWHYEYMGRRIRRSTVVEPYRSLGFL